MPNPVPTELSLLDRDVAAPALTLANNVFTYANNVFTLASQLPAHQLHKPVAPTNTVFAPANNALALAKVTALFSIISRRSQKYRDPQIAENKAQSPKSLSEFSAEADIALYKGKQLEEEH
jgi:hypothetical protein